MHRCLQLEDKEHVSSTTPLWKKKWFWKLSLFLAFSVMNLLLGIGFAIFNPKRVSMGYGSGSSAFHRGATIYKLGRTRRMLVTAEADPL